jgi:hypothetical protein
MDEFVCVRMVQGNGMDLALFQFDYDMSFAVFFLNADRTVYGRYGSRNHKPKEAHADISMKGLAEAMRGALELHAAYPANRDSLRGKTGPKPEFATPEKLPHLADSGRDRPELAVGDRKAINRSCIHCHMIHDSERSTLLAKGERIPAEILYPWPMPEVIGLSLDVRTRATVRRVSPDTPAAGAGIRAGDEIVRLGGQPVISIADVQWVLDQAGPSATLGATLRRDDKEIPATITLEDGWREKSDISWRASSWPLRRIATGGLTLVELTAPQRRHHGIGADRMALRVEHVGQFNKHAAAKRAGFRKGDVIVSYDGRTDPWSESDLFAYVVNNKRPGARVPTTVIRGDRRVELKLPVQE